MSRVIGMQEFERYKNLTPSQKREIKKEYFEKNKRRIMANAKDVKEMSMLDRNEMKTIDKKHYKQANEDFKLVHNHLRGD